MHFEMCSLHQGSRNQCWVSLCFTWTSSCFCFGSKDQYLVTNSINLIIFRGKKSMSIMKDVTAAWIPFISVSLFYTRVLCWCLLFALLPSLKQFTFCSYRIILSFGFVIWIESSVGKMQSASCCKLNVSCVFFLSHSVCHQYLCPDNSVLSFTSDQHLCFSPPNIQKSFLLFFDFHIF